LILRSADIWESRNSLRVKIQRVYESTKGGSKRGEKIRIGGAEDRFREGGVKREVGFNGEGLLEMEDCRDLVGGGGGRLGAHQGLQPKKLG